MKCHLSSFLRAFCFPPCPRSILEHLALKPPPPNYALTLEEDARYTLEIIAADVAILELINLELIKQACLMKDIEFCFVRPRDRSNSIFCLYYRVKPATTTTILYSHGSDSDLGSAIFVCIWLANHLHCNIMAYDYSGYGLSPGKPSEKRIYANIELAFKLLEDRCLPEDVILYGKGLGSAPTLHLASKIPVRGVVVQSGFTSLLNIAFPSKHPRTRCCDVFGNIDKISKVFSPVLVIHGTEDTKVNLSHGKAIFERSPVPVQPLWVEGGTHDDLESHSEFLSRLKQFVSVELPEIQNASN